MNITIVTFNPTGDTVEALYIDNELLHYGDEYHNQINTFLKGFIEGLKHCEFNFTLEKIKCYNEELNYNIWELADTPPKNITFVELN